MARLRRAILFASCGRYLVMAVNLGSATILARLLTPAEFGIAVLGTAVLGIAEAIRELGSTAYLVQQQELTQDKVRTVFTVSLIVTLTVTGLLSLLAAELATFYELPQLTAYIKVGMFGYMIAPFAHPIYSLLSRELAFQKLALLDVLTTIVGAVASIWLVLLGAGYLGIAWAGVISAVTWTLLGFYLQRDFSIYRPSLREWRSVLRFGICGSATAVLYRTSESLFYLIIGKLLDPRSAGLCQRAVMLAQFPERVILAGVGAVALPALSEAARQGHCLKSAYLAALGNIAVVQWPALILLAVLADPIVSLLYGQQWHEVVPLVKIFAAAFMLNFPTTLNYPVQVAAGAIRHTVPLALTQCLISLSIFSIAGHFGLKGVALASLLSVPTNVVLSILVVRQHIGFAWRDLIAAIKTSLCVAVFAAVGPLAVAMTGWKTGHLSSSAVGLAVGLSGLGWFLGLRLTSHPMLLEFRHALEAATRGLGLFHRS